MGKHMVRILLIMLVAGLVSGGLYAFAQTEVAASIGPERGEHGPPPHLRGESRDRGESDRWEGAEAARFSEGRAFEREGGEHDHHGDHRDSLSVPALLSGMGKDLVGIALVVLVVVAIQKVAGLIGGTPKRAALSGRE